MLDLRGPCRMVDRFAADAGVEVRIARGVGHDRRLPAVPIETSSPPPVVRLLWHDMQLSEWTKSDALRCGRCARCGRRRLRALRARR